MFLSDSLLGLNRAPTARRPRHGAHGAAPTARATPPCSSACMTVNATSKPLAQTFAQPRGHSHAQTYGQPAEPGTGPGTDPGTDPGGKQSGIHPARARRRRCRSRAARGAAPEREMSGARMSPVSPLSSLRPRTATERVRQRRRAHPISAFHHMQRGDRDRDRDRAACGASPSPVRRAGRTQSPAPPHSWRIVHIDAPALGCAAITLPASRSGAALPSACAAARWLGRHGARQAEAEPSSATARCKAVSKEPTCTAPERRRPLPRAPRPNDAAGGEGDRPTPPCQQE
jgi:hypothetical protein